MNKLKRCEQCGGTANFVSTINGLPFSTYEKGQTIGIQCTSCGIGITGKSADDATENWNKSKSNSWKH
jgi:hypothetical protein